jgi:hypothetical protein
MTCEPETLRIPTWSNPLEVSSQLQWQANSFMRPHRVNSARRLLGFITPQFAGTQVPRRRAVGRFSRGSRTASRPKAPPPPPAATTVQFSVPVRFFVAETEASDGDDDGQSAPSFAPPSTNPQNSKPSRFFKHRPSGRSPFHPRPHAASARLALARLPSGVLSRTH